MLHMLCAHERVKLVGDAIDHVTSVGTSRQYRIILQSYTCIGNRCKPPAVGGDAC
jgi:hypothetical protein